MIDKLSETSEEEIRAFQELGEAKYLRPRNETEYKAILRRQEKTGDQLSHYSEADPQHKPLWLQSRELNMWIKEFTHWFSRKGGEIPDLPTDEIELEDEDDQPFKSSLDFSSVVVKGERYTFTQTQSLAIQVLYKAYENGTYDLHQGTILHETMSKCTRLRDIFRVSPAWGKLIVPGERKGTFRLKI